MASYSTAPAFKYRLRTSSYSMHILEGQHYDVLVARVDDLCIAESRKHKVLDLVSAFEGISLEISFEAEKGVKVDQTKSYLEQWIQADNKNVGSA
jgi:hypothetical protein